MYFYAQECTDFITIASTSYVTKDPQKVLIKRIKREFRSELIENQFQLLQDKGKPKAINVLKTLSERCRELDG